MSAFLQLRFSVRTLLIGVSLLCIVLALSVRFGPHVLWLALESPNGSNVDPIPTKPLVASELDEPVVTCTIGTMSFDLPESMSKKVRVEQGNIVFEEGKRALIVEVPGTSDNFLRADPNEFPAQSSWNFPRLYVAICQSQSSDFSFAMSRDELAWHKRLRKWRAQIDSVSGVEFLWKPNLESVLLVCRRRANDFHVASFDWSTIGGESAGSVMFYDESGPNAAWIGHTCTTFSVDGEFDVGPLDSNAIEAAIQFAPVVGQGE